MRDVTGRRRFSRDEENFGRKQLLYELPFQRRVLTMRETVATVQRSNRHAAPNRKRPDER